jgi:hypothetical protein
MSMDSYLILYQRIVQSFISVDRFIVLTFYGFNESLGEFLVSIRDFFLHLGPLYGTCKVSMGIS